MAMEQNPHLYKNIKNPSYKVQLLGFQKSLECVSDTPNIHPDVKYLVDITWCNKYHWFHLLNSKSLEIQTHVIKSRGILIQIHS